MNSVFGGRRELEGEWCFWMCSFSAACNFAKTLLRSVNIFCISFRDRAFKGKLSNLFCISFLRPWFILSNTFFRKKDCFHWIDRDVTPLKVFYKELVFQMMAFAGQRETLKGDHSLCQPCIRGQLLMKGQYLFQEELRWGCVYHYQQIHLHSFSDYYNRTWREKRAIVLQTFSVKNYLTEV